MIEIYTNPTIYLYSASIPKYNTPGTIEKITIMKNSLKPVGIFLNNPENSFALVKNKKNIIMGEITSEIVNMVFPNENTTLIPSQMDSPSIKARNRSKFVFSCIIFKLFHLFYVFSKHQKV